MFRKAIPQNVDFYWLAHEPVEPKLLTLVLILLCGISADGINRHRPQFSLLHLVKENRSGFVPVHKGHHAVH